MAREDYDWFYLDAYGEPDRLRKVEKFFYGYKNSEDINKGQISCIVSRVMQEPEIKEFEELAKVFCVKIRYQYLDLPSLIWDYRLCEYDEALADEYIKKNLNR